MGEKKEIFICSTCEDKGIVIDERMYVWKCVCRRGMARTERFPLISQRDRFLRYQREEKDQEWKGTSNV